MHASGAGLWQRLLRTDCVCNKAEKKKQTSIKQKALKGIETSNHDDKVLLAYVERTATRRAGSRPKILEGALPPSAPSSASPFSPFSETEKYELHDW